VAGAGELLGGGQPGRAGADDGDPLPVSARRLRADQAVGPGPVGDLDLDLLDGDRVVVDAEHAGGLARRRAQPPVNSGKLLVACSRSDASASRPSTPGRSTPG
jgi:hypothetical protein